MLIPKRLNKDLGSHFDMSKDKLEDQLQNQEQQYQELLENYNDQFIYQRDEFQFNSEDLLPDPNMIESIQLPDNVQLQSEQNQNTLLAIRFDQNTNDIERQYPDAQKNLDKINNSQQLGRWPFITGLNTINSSFMHFLLGNERLTYLKAQFKNDYLLQYEKLPSYIEIEKRSELLAKIYCKNSLKVEQSAILKEIEDLVQQKAQ